VCADDARRPLRFFQRILQAFDDIAAWPEVTGFYPHPLAEWRGDQLVPAAVVGWEAFRAQVLSGATDRLEVDGVAVAFLPSDPWCHAYHVDAPDAVLGKRIVDFKGARKAHLEAVARRMAASFPTTGPLPAGSATYRLATPTEAATAAGVSVAARIADAAVEPTAQPLAGALQHPVWLDGFEPLSATLLRLPRATALAPNLIVLPDGRVLDDGNGFPPSEQVHHAATRGAVAAAGEGAISIRPAARERVAVAERVAYLAASANYAEWLLGDAPRATLYDDDTPLVLHGEAGTTHRDTLELLGIAPERVRPYPADARLDFAGGLAFCTTTFQHHTPCATALRRLRARALERLPGGGPARVYLSRAGIAGSRRIRNEDAIEAMLAERGFDIVRPETLTVPEQAAVVAYARLIVGPYGANLANLVFAATGSRTVIIATKPQPEFARLLALLGLAFRHVVPAAVKVRDGATYSESYEFELDLALLARALDAPAR
jgi:hypothetical protein